MKQFLLLVSVLIILPCNTACGEKRENKPTSALENSPGTTGRVRAPAVAGGFYTANPRQLSNNIEKYLSQANPPKIPGPAIGLIVPHAGYVYSGAVAAFSYKMVQGQTYDVVIISGTSHSYRFPGASIYDGDAYATPLGEVPIDRELAARLVAANPFIRWNSSASGLDGGTVHDREHSLEVQLPFIQNIFPEGVKFIPLLFGSQDLSICRSVSDTLAKILTKEGKKALLLGSTDLTHYPTYADANRIDPVTLKKIAAMKIEPLAEYFDTHNLRQTPNLATLACGRAGIYLTLLTAQKLGAKHGKVIKYANSADVAIGDKGRVVGYGAVVFYGESP